MLQARLTPVHEPQRKKGRMRGQGRSVGAPMCQIYQVITVAAGAFSALKPPGNSSSGVKPSQASLLEPVGVYGCHGRRRGGARGGGRALLQGWAGDAIEALGCCCHPARGQCQGLALAVQALPADAVVPLPVLVLAEGAAVAGDVAAAARLAGLAAAVPAALQEQRHCA